jgi:hypothetical protein
MGGSAETELYQSCPHCAATAPAALIDAEEALRHWPERKSHFSFRLPVPGSGWGKPTEWRARAPIDRNAWDSLLARRRRDRELVREAERRKDEERRAQQKRKNEEYAARREADERRLKAEAQAQLEEAKRHEEQRCLKAAEERRAQDARRAEERRYALRQLAAQRIKKPEIRELWLTTSQPKLRLLRDSVSPKPLDVAAESPEGLERAKEFLLQTKF